MPCLGQSAARNPFSQEEHARLAAGELVTRPVSERRGDLRLIGGSSWQVIKAPPEAVFRALLDTRHYDRSLPTVSGASLVSDHEDVRRVRIEHKKGPLGIAYRLALQIDAQQRDITFKLNDPLNSGLHAAWGFFSVRPYGAGESLLSYGIMADPGEGLIVGLVRSVIQEWILKAPAQVRKFVESSAAKALYTSSFARVGGQRDGGHAQQGLP